MADPRECARCSRRILNSFLFHFLDCARIFLGFQPMTERFSIAGSGAVDGGSSLPWAAAVVFVCAVGWVGPSIWGQICWLGGRVNSL